MKPNKLIPILIFALSVSVGVYADEDDDDDEVQQVEVVNTPLEVTGTVSGEVEVTNTVGVDVLSLPSTDDSVDVRFASGQFCAVGSNATLTCSVTTTTKRNLYTAVLSVRGRNLTGRNDCRAIFQVLDATIPQTQRLMTVYATSDDPEQISLAWPRPLRMDAQDQFQIEVTNFDSTIRDEICISLRDRSGRLRQRPRWFSGAVLRADDADDRYDNAR